MHGDTLTGSTLTQEDATLLRSRLKQDQEHLAVVQASHDDLAVKIRSREALIDALEESITRALRLLGEEGPLLPTAAAHRDMFGGALPPLAGEVVPSPAREALGDGQPPDGLCIHCGEPVWRVSVTEASPKGARHSYGATCNPEDNNSGVADLGEVVS
ncbi:hypothetical protein ABGB18_11295 [Nonomuraea sp. B12E4]|uniref:hypothetical protein n=1 Tax=Nonomuraea sp. B12E4 TaxID=3153564 RepID=UPI00325DEDDC